jgi:5-methylcytosine-specific restriction endonuclease McrA
MRKGVAGRRELGDWIRSVGVGVVFTRNDIQAAFPGVDQLDRRVRDLRGCGWIIVTNRQDKNLRPGQLRCDQFGVDHRTPGPTDSVRRAVILRDHRQCQVCGAIAGQHYPGEPDRTAHVEAAYRTGARSYAASAWEARCDRCFGADNGHPTGDADRVWAAINDLSGEDKETLRAWMEIGRRPIDSADRVFADLCALPPAERDRIAESPTP